MRALCRSATVVVRRTGRTRIAPPGTFGGAKGNRPRLHITCQKGRLLGCSLILSMMLGLAERNATQQEGGCQARLWKHITQNTCSFPLHPISQSYIPQGHTELLAYPSAVSILMRRTFVFRVYDQRALTFTKKTAICFRTPCTEMRSYMCIYSIWCYTQYSWYIRNIYTNNKYFFSCSLP